MRIGINTYGLKEELLANFEGTFSRLKEQGYDSLEICVQLKAPGTAVVQISDDMSAEEAKWSASVWPMETAAERLHIVRGMGIRVDGCHLILPDEATPEMLHAMIPEIIQIGQTLKLSYFVLSLMLQTEAMRAYVPVLNEVVDACEKEGFAFLYHNHDMECIPNDGVNAMELLIAQCPKLFFEVDLGWLMIGSVDPVDFMSRCGDRIKVLHFKDFSSVMPPSVCLSCICAVGEGVLPMSEIASASKHCSLAWGGLIVDQDTSLGEILRDTATGIANLKKTFSEEENK